MAHSLLALAGWLLLPAAALADLSGFDASAYDTYRSGTTTLPVVSAKSVQLTEAGTSNTATSIFSKTTQSLTGAWTAHFTYKITLPEEGHDPADGFAFVVKNSTTNLGNVGGDVGYRTITDSVAIVVRTYPGGTHGIGLGTEGDLGAASEPANVSFTKTSPVTFDLCHDPDAKAIEVLITQDGVTNRARYDVDIASVLGASTGLVGFTGGTGGESQGTTISDFSFQEAADPEIGVPHVANYGASSAADVARQGNIQLTSSGTMLTGTLLWGGAKYSLKGKISEEQNTVITVSKKKVAGATLKLDIAVHGQGHRMAVDLTDSEDNSTYSGVLLPAVPRPKQTFTVTLGEEDPPSPSAPSASGRGAASNAFSITGSKGYAVVKTSSNGTSRIAGVAPDGTKFSASLASGFFDQAPLFAQLYKVKKLGTGHLTGTVLTPGGLVPNSKSGLAAASLRRPGNFKKLYPAGVFEEFGVVSSRFAKDDVPLDFNFTPPSQANGTMAVEGGNTGDFQTAIRVVDGKPAATFPSGAPNKEKLTLKSSGLITGSFHSPGTSKVRKFKGVSDQVSNVGVGTFIGDTLAGSVTVTPF